MGSNSTVASIEYPFCGGVEEREDKIQRTQTLGSLVHGSCNSKAKHKLVAKTDRIDWDILFWCLFFFFCLVSVYVHPDHPPTVLCVLWCRCPQLLSSAMACSTRARQGCPFLYKPQYFGQPILQDVTYPCSFLGHWVPRWLKASKDSLVSLKWWGIRKGFCLDLCAWGMSQSFIFQIAFCYREAMPWAAPIFFQQHVSDFVQFSAVG